MSHWGGLLLLPLHPNRFLTELCWLPDYQVGCIPYLATWFKDCQHKCGNCGTLLAVWHRSGRTEVMAHQTSVWELCLEEFWRNKWIDEKTSLRAPIGRISKLRISEKKATVRGNTNCFCCPRANMLGMNLTILLTTIEGTGCNNVLKRCLYLVSRVA